MEITIEKLKQLQEESLAHYDAILIYVELQIKKCGKNKDISFNHSLDLFRKQMFFDIKENWGGNSCSYCTFFGSNINNDCPLGIGCLLCCDGQWDLIWQSKILMELKIALQNVKQYIADHGADI